MSQCKGFIENMIMLAEEDVVPLYPLFLRLPSMLYDMDDYACCRVPDWYLEISLDVRQARPAR